MVTTLAGDEAALARPAGIAAAIDGTLYVTELISGGVRALAPDGRAREVALSGGRLGFPSGVAVDGNTLVIADSGHARLARVELSSGRVTTVAGSGWGGFFRGRGAAARRLPVLGAGAARAGGRFAGTRHRGGRVGGAPPAGPAPAR